MCVWCECMPLGKYPLNITCALCPEIFIAVKHATFLSISKCTTKITENFLIDTLQYTSRIAFIGFFSLFFFGGVWCYVKLCLFKPNSWMRRADYMSTSHAFLALGICLASVTSCVFQLALTPSAQVMMKFVFGDEHMFSLSNIQSPYAVLFICNWSHVKRVASLFKPLFSKHHTRW